MWYYFGWGILYNSVVFGNRSLRVAGILTIFKRTAEHSGRRAMSGKRGPKAEADGQPQTTARKPWHAPSFNCSDIDETYAVANANTDGATTGADGTLS